MRTIKFLLVFVLFSISCDSDEEQNPVYEGIVGKSFLLTHYNDGVNQQDEFLFITFTFNSDKTVVVNKHGEILNGTWDLHKGRDINFYSILHLLKFDFPNNPDLQTFEKYWQVNLYPSNDIIMSFGTASLNLHLLP